MDPTKLLEADHRRVEALFAAIEEAEGEARLPLVDDLASSLRSHMELEERLLYSAMAPVTGEEAVAEGEKEHALARKSLRDMVGLAPDRPGFGAALAATKGAIEHHVEEEENDIFPDLREDGTLLRKLASPFVAARWELGLPMDADALADASTKDELLDRAHGAGIAGTSSMDKSELAEAVVAVMRDDG